MIKSRRSIRRPRRGPNNELMRAFEDAKGIEMEESSDDSSVERANRLNDKTMIGGMPWSEMKHRVAKIGLTKVLP